MTDEELLAGAEGDLPDIEAVATWASDDVEFLPQPRIGATNAFKIAVATFIAQQGGIISLHRADPGPAGTANEITTSATRKTTVWSAPGIIADGSANDGRAQITGSVVEFTVAGGVPIAYYGVWKDAATFLYSKPFLPAVELLASGTVKIKPVHMYGLV